MEQDQKNTSITQNQSVHDTNAANGVDTSVPRVGTRLRKEEEVVVYTPTTATTSKPPLESTPITNYNSDPTFNYGKLIATNLKYMVYARRDNQIRVINKFTVHKTLLRAHSLPVTDIRFLRDDGNVMATIAKDNSLIIWEIVDSAPETDENGVSAKIILHVKSASSQSPKSTPQPNSPSTQQQQPTAYYSRVEWYQDANNCTNLVVASTNGELSVWSVDILCSTAAHHNSVEIERTDAMPGIRVLIPASTRPTSWVTDMKLSYGGRLLAASFSNGTVSLWQTVTLTKLYDFQPYDAAHVASLCSKTLPPFQPINAREQQLVPSSADAVLSVRFLGGPHMPEFSNWFVTGTKHNSVFSIWRIDGLDAQHNSNQPQISDNDSVHTDDDDSAQVRVVHMHSVVLDFGAAAAAATATGAKPLIGFLNQVELERSGQFLIAANTRDSTVYIIHLSYQHQQDQQHEEDEGDDHPQRGAGAVDDVCFDYISEFSVSEPILNFATMTAVTEQTTAESDSTASTTGAEQQSKTRTNIGMFCILPKSMQLLHVTDEMCYTPQPMPKADSTTAVATAETETDTDAAIGDDAEEEEERASCISDMRSTQVEINSVADADALSMYNDILSPMMLMGSGGAAPNDTYDNGQPDELPETAAATPGDEGAQEEKLQRHLQQYEDESEPPLSTRDDGYEEEDEEDDQTDDADEYDDSQHERSAAASDLEAEAARQQQQQQEGSSATIDPLSALYAMTNAHDQQNAPFYSSGFGATGGFPHYATTVEDLEAQFTSMSADDSSAVAAPVSTLFAAASAHQPEPQPQSDLYNPMYAQQHLLQMLQNPQQQQQQQQQQEPQEASTAAQPTKDKKKKRADSKERDEPISEQQSQATIDNAILAKEFKKFETAMITKLNNAIDKRTEKHYSTFLQRFDTERTTRLAEDKDNHNKLIIAISQTLATEIPEEIEHVVANQMQATILPMMTQQMETKVLKALQDQLTASLQKTLVPRIEKLLGDAIEKSITKHMNEKLSAASLSNAVRTPIQESFKSCFQELLIPAFEKSCQHMFSQISATFDKGLEERIEQPIKNYFDRNAADRTALNEQLQTSISQFNATIAQLQQQMKLIETQLQQTTASMSAVIASAASAAPSVAAPISTSQHTSRTVSPASATTKPATVPMFNTLLQQPLATTPVGAPHGQMFASLMPQTTTPYLQPQQAATPPLPQSPVNALFGSMHHYQQQQQQPQPQQHTSPQVKPQPQPHSQPIAANVPQQPAKPLQASATARPTPSEQQELRRLIAQQSYDEAFTKALSANNLDVLVWLCSVAPVGSVFTASGTLMSQPVILSLIQQLAFDLSRALPLKITWLHNCIAALKETDSSIAVHVAPILTFVARNVDSALAQSAAAQHQQLVQALTMVKNAITSKLSRK